ncbi:peptidase MA family metallohydrolase [Stigmatella sp. ncwal1]|uniref:Peptidase MA family metallohydrolase n=1 Tax=Stigmatella ashevillensis TaxID=2995309 RepID=A0ABT5D3Q9_9BACT|nr:peptidase MA family metallohydrolase [Stigmatella ashevillena]MDC0708295.1 peptidase MA family metallohydrolase [Stigmatella ashevillena]
MRLLLLMFLLLLAPRASAQEGSVSAHGVGEPALLPTSRPEQVAGEIATPRFRLLYTQASEGTARALSENIEAVRESFVKVLGRDWPGTTEIRIGLGREEYEALALPGGQPPGWAVALAYPTHGIILLEARSLNTPEGPVTLRHELAHVALGQIGGTWPRWFQEGMAQHLTGERIALTHYAAIFRAVAQQRVFEFEDLAQGWPDMRSDVEIAYAQSADFVAYLASVHGAQSMSHLLNAVAAGEPFEKAFGKAFHSSLTVEENAWRGGLATRFGWLPLTTSMQLAWMVAPALCVVAYLRRRQQQAARLEAMSQEEAAEDAEMERLAAEAALQQQPPAQEGILVPWPAPLSEEQREAMDEEEARDPSLPKPTLH